MGFTKTHTRTCKNPQPAARVWVFTGTGEGCRKKPQGFPWQSLVRALAKEEQHIRNSPPFFKKHKKCLFMQNFLYQKTPIYFTNSILLEILEASVSDPHYSKYPNHTLNSTLQFQNW